MKRAVVPVVIISLIILTSITVEIRSEIGIQTSDVEITANGRTLAAVEAFPDGDHSDNSLPAVAVFHGFTANKEMMRPFIEGLSRVGFYVIAVDQQGHGQSSGNLREDGENSLRNDGVEIIEYIRDQALVDPTRVGILGHSMGAGAAISTSVEVSNLASTVLLGNSLSGIEEYNVTPSFPENVLMGIGKYDELFTVDAAKSSFKALIGSEPQINTMYGEFSEGTARELLVTATDHILEVINPELVERSIEWLYQSMIDSSISIGQGELKSINGWTFVFDQLLSAFAGLLLISLIPVMFWYLPQLSTSKENDILWLTHGTISFLSFMLAIPAFIVIDLGFVPLFATWFILGGLFYTLVTLKRSNTGITDVLQDKFEFNQDQIFAIGALVILMGITHLILYFVHWDYRYVLPLLGFLSLRRLGLFFLIFVPGIFFFTMEITALQGRKVLTWMEFFKEISARIWMFTLLLLLHYIPIIVFQTPLLPSIFGFLAFFIVGLLPVMVILSVFSMVGRSYGWSNFAIAIVSAGLIAWMLASTLSFNA